MVVSFLAGLTAILAWGAYDNGWLDIKAPQNETGREVIERSFEELE